MVWEEWEELKTQAARRDKMSMQLDHAAPLASGGEAGDESGDLQVKDTDLVAIGDAAYRLYGALDHWGDHARISSMAAAGGLKSSGFELGDGLDHVAERWVYQVRNLLDACGHISNHLDYTRKTHAGDEERIVGIISSISQLDKGFDHREEK